MAKTTEKWFLRFFAVLAVVLIYHFFFGPPKSDPPTTYPPTAPVNPAAGPATSPIEQYFRVELPKGWQPFAIPKELERNGLQMRSWRPSDHSQSSFVVTVKDVGPGTYTFQDFLAGVRKSEARRGVTILVDKPATLDTLDCRELIETYSARVGDQIHEIVSVQIYCLKDLRFFGFSGTTAGSDASKAETLFQPIFDSVRWTK